MGPRPFGRGRTAKLADLAEFLKASMGPRPFGRGRREAKTAARSGLTASMGPRPFGRGRLPLNPRKPCLLPPLQWGRDLSVAEGGYLSPHAIAHWSLQWGRDLSVAEGVQILVRVRLGLPRFNGAATFRSRKVRSHAKAGRCAMASMGPRPFGRGRSISRNSANGRLKRFNGAATFRSRKGWIYQAEGDRWQASMGPRPFGRGRTTLTRLLS